MKPDPNAKVLGVCEKVIPIIQATIESLRLDLSAPDIASHPYVVCPEEIYPFVICKMEENTSKLSAMSDSQKESYVIEIDDNTYKLSDEWLYRVNFTREQAEEVVREWNANIPPNAPSLMVIERKQFVEKTLPIEEYSLSEFFRIKNEELYGIETFEDRRNADRTLGLFEQGKKDAFLGNPRETGLCETWARTYDEGFQEGERLRCAAQEVDTYREKIAWA